MVGNLNYNRIPRIHQSRVAGLRLKKRDSLLAQGCRGPTAGRRVLYLATPIDQFHHPEYHRVLSCIAARLPAREWAIFEPARCNWTTADWLRAWPRLVRWTDVLVIWPRRDSSVGFGVFQEACDIQSKGKPVYVFESGDLKTFRGFGLLRGGPFHYARVRAGKAVRRDKMLGGEV